MPYMILHQLGVAQSSDVDAKISGPFIWFQNMNRFVVVVEGRVQY